MLVKERLEKLQAEIAVAAKRSGRTLENITLIAVTKYASLQQMEETLDAGLFLFGESRLQTALVKQEHFRFRNIAWHFIGNIQSNKALPIAKNFSCIHSISSLKLAKKFSSLATSHKIPCFLEVNATGESSKHGFSLTELEAAQEELFLLDGLAIQGLMAMGSRKDPRASFRKVAQAASQLPEGSRQLSMGMSHDFPIAIEEGATHIRIGSYLYS